MQQAAYLCNMAVDPSWRKLGVGKALLDAAEQVRAESFAFIFVAAET